MPRRWRYGTWPSAPMDEGESGAIESSSKADEQTMPAMFPLVLHEVCFEAAGKYLIDHISCVTRGPTHARWCWDRTVPARACCCVSVTGSSRRPVGRFGGMAWRSTPRVGIKPWCFNVRYCCGAAWRPTSAMPCASTACHVGSARRWCTKPCKQAGLGDLGWAIGAAPVRWRAATPRAGAGSGAQAPGLAAG